MGLKYIVDSYAIIEWFVLNNKNYKNYFHKITKEGAAIITLVKMEVYFCAMKKIGKAGADKLYEVMDTYFYEFQIEKERIKKACLLKQRMMQKKMSQTDCLLHEIAKENNLKVLTGDEHFKDLSHTEFVK